MNTKPFISRCAAVENYKNINGTRCKNIPDGNGYFCKTHFHKLHDEKIMAIKIRGMPNVIGHIAEVWFVQKINKHVKDAIDKKLEKRHKIEAENIKELNRSKVIDYTEVKKEIKYETNNEIKDIQEVIENLALDDNNMQVEKNDISDNNKIYINNRENEDRIKEYEGLDGNELRIVAEAFKIKGKFSRKNLILEIIKKEQEYGKT